MIPDDIPEQMRLRLMWMLGLSLGLVVFVAHYAHFGRMGLYQDDYAFVGTSLGHSTTAAIHNVKSSLSHWPQGRPVGFAISEILTAIVTRCSTEGSLALVYLAGFAVVWLNSVLMLGLLSRLLPLRASYIGALCFALLPADTTKAFLTHRNSSTAGIWNRGSRG
jgi:hypothetical protein